MDMFAAPDPFLDLRVNGDGSFYIQGHSNDRASEDPIQRLALSTAIFSGPTRKNPPECLSAILCRARGWPPRPMQAPKLQVKMLDLPRLKRRLHGFCGMMAIPQNSGNLFTNAPN